MRYHVQGVGESIRFEILAGHRGEGEVPEKATLCDERICEAAEAIASEPWAWALDTARPAARRE
jgi:hypothetical protein